MELSSLVTKTPQHVDMLTCEAGKIYGLYIVRTDGKIEDATSFSLALISDGWKDHCIIPDNFHKLAALLNCGYDNDTFAHICRSFVENYLWSDWTKLHEYLPKDGGNLYND